jgi:hypothetical protein
MSLEVIRDTSETLIKLLRDNINITGISDDNVIIASPTDIGNAAITTTAALYLYALVENPDLKNGVPIFVNHKQSRRAPLSLNLYYMLTVYPAKKENPKEIHNENLITHRVLARAIRIFYDNGILAGSILQGVLGTSDLILRISLNPITLEDLTRIWSVFPDSPYRPSVCYLVTPVRIDSAELTSTQRVVEKELDHAPIVPTPKEPQ